MVLRKSDCDIKYIIFKVKKQQVRPCPLCSPSFFITLGSPVWEIPRIIYLLISAGETGTHTRERSGEKPLATGPGLAATSFIAPCRPGSQALLVARTQCTVYPERMRPRSSGPWKSPKCRPRHHSLGALGAPPRARSLRLPPAPDSLPRQRWWDGRKAPLGKPGAPSLAEPAAGYRELRQVSTLLCAKQLHSLGRSRPPRPQGLA